MDVDGASVPGEIDQNLLLQFSCMNTTDREELIKQMQKLLGPSLNYNTASFFLDMSNWYVCVLSLFIILEYIYKGR